MQRIIIAWRITVGLWIILSLFAIDAAFTARAILYSYQSEIAALKQQQDANAATINYLVDQTFYLRELVQRATKNQIPQ